VFRKHKLVRNTSTGSTGIPTTFFEDGTTTAMNWVHELRVKQWFGIQPGSRDARLARVSTQYLPKSTVSRFRKLLWNHLILPGVNLSAPEYTLMLNRMEAFQPKVLWGYTSALTGLADFIKQSGYNVKKLPVELLISWAAPLYDHERILLEEVFGCPATNIYGTREVGHIGIECPNGTLHINEENYIVENEPSRITGSTEDPGEILVTPLYEAQMPFIRYSIGDLGRVVPSTCECGRSLEVIDDLLGRTGEVFHTSDGHMIAPNFWCRFFMIDLQNKSVKKFQVIYEKTDYVRLKIVKKENYTDETESVIKKLLTENFPKDTEFDIQYVDKIDPKPSGKEEMVINKVISET
jgi:phenylacetate-CoA ligase